MSWPPSYTPTQNVLTSEILNYRSISLREWQADMDCDKDRRDRDRTMTRLERGIEPVAKIEARITHVPYLPHMLYF